jgi:hypothetical protein|tara:strand:+ start:8314 stop:8790 length:477 start_codon:yes stop_codon:yes gene_type:complete
MFLRVFAFLLLLLFCNSCDLVMGLDDSKIETLDTIIDFSSVDFSPSFPVCDSIITKQEKSACFRNTMHAKISSELQKHSFTIKEAVSETVFVHLLISANGTVVLDEIQSSENIQIQLPTLDSLLKISVRNLPKITPASKRGIPVVTKYSLPIEIQLKK